VKIRFSNPFLVICGIGWAAYNLITGGSIFTHFMFGVCFGLIYLNYKEENK